MSNDVRVKRVRVGHRAAGTLEGGRHPKISIKFEQDLFDQINDYAQANRMSFGETVRTLMIYAFDNLNEENAEAGSTSSDSSEIAAPEQSSK